MKKAGDVLGERGAARDREPRAPPERLVDAREAEAGREAMREPKRGRQGLFSALITAPARADRHRPAESCPANGARGIGPGANSLVGVLVNSRHGDKNRRPELR